MFVIVAAAAGFALLQIGRHRLQANDTVGGVRAQSAAGAVQRPACTSTNAQVEPAGAASGAPNPASIILRLDYAGAEALINALERDSLSDADVDSLLRIRGLCAMVDNVARFFPGTGVSEFRKDIRTFVRTKKRGDDDRYFQLSNVWQARFKVRALIAGIQTNERDIVLNMAHEAYHHEQERRRLLLRRVRDDKSDRTVSGSREGGQTPELR